MSDNNIYTTPEAPLQKKVSRGSVGGSVEDGISGNYTLGVRATIGEAWGRVKGAKADLWLAMLLYMVCLGVVQIIVGQILIPVLGDILGSSLGQVLITLVSVPLNLGFAILSLRRMADAPLRSTSLFDYFDKMLPLFLCTLLSYLLIAIGFLLLILPGIYLWVAYMFAPTLVGEKGMKIWDALEASRKAVTHKWFTIFVILIAIGFINLFASIPLFIGLIWSIPLSILILGNIYFKLFGVEAETLEGE